MNYKNIQIETVYEISYLLLFKKTCNKKPRDMRDILLVLKSSNLSIPVIDESQYTEKLKLLREFLNKVTKENYLLIHERAVQSFVYQDKFIKSFFVSNF